MLQETESSSRIYVGKYAERTSPGELERIFSRFGKIKAIVAQRGYCFIEYFNRTDAEQAIEKMNGSLLDGFNLLVEWCKTEKPSGPGDSCFVCGNKGHWADACPENVGGLNVKSGRCFKCGEQGHLAKYCRKPRLDPREIAKRDMEQRNEPYRGDYDYRRRSYSPPPMAHPPIPFSRDPRDPPVPTPRDMPLREPPPPLGRDPRDSIREPLPSHPPRDHPPPHMYRRDEFDYDRRYERYSSRGPPPFPPPGVPPPPLDYHRRGRSPPRYPGEYDYPRRHSPPRYYQEDYHRRRSRSPPRRFSPPPPIPRPRSPGYAQSSGRFMEFGAGYDDWYFGGRGRYDRSMSPRRRYPYEAQSSGIGGMARAEMRDEGIKAQYMEERNGGNAQRTPEEIGNRK